MMLLMQGNDKSVDGWAEQKMGNQELLGTTLAGSLYEHDETTWNN